MKVKEGFVLRKMGGQSVVVSIDAASTSFNGIIKLNESGDFLWHELEKDKSEEELVCAMLESYDVSENVAREGVAAFLETLKKSGIIE